MQSTLNETATSNDTVYIKWFNLHQMIESTLNDTVTLNDTIYVKWYNLH